MTNPRRILAGLLFAVSLTLVSLSAQPAKQINGRKTDSEIKREIINRSIADYPGNCPCPYNTDRAGRQCGRRSAYSRPGGASPICYAEDVTVQMVNEYRAASKRQ
jgi:hypothetical protein